MEIRRQGITLFTAVCVLIAILVVIQLWLVAAALDAALGGESGIAWPASIASIVLFLVNGGLLLPALDFDRRLRQRDAND